MTCSPSHGWLCRSTPCTSFPPRMRSYLRGSDFYPGGSTSHWIHQPSPGHTVRLLPPEPLVVKQPQSTRVEGADTVMQSSAAVSHLKPVWHRAHLSLPKVDDRGTCNDKCSPNEHARRGKLSKEEKIHDLKRDE